MAYFDGFAPTYTFRIMIERSDRPVLDAAFTTKGTPKEIQKVKRSIQKLLREYPQASEKTLPEEGYPTDDASEEVGQPDTIQKEVYESETTLSGEADQEEEMDLEATPAQDSTTTRTHFVEGARGLLRMCCPDCGKTFMVFLKDFQTEVSCNCGHSFDLTLPLAKFQYVCPYCENERYGRTNSEEALIQIRCKCGGDVDLEWNPKTKEYRN